MGLVNSMEGATREVEVSFPSERLVVTEHVVDGKYVYNLWRVKGETVTNLNQEHVSDGDPGPVTDEVLHCFEPHPALEVFY